MSDTKLTAEESCRQVLKSIADACDQESLAHKLRDPKFYTARTKRAVNSLTVERGPKGGAS